MVDEANQELQDASVAEASAGGAAAPAGEAEAKATSATQDAEPVAADHAGTEGAPAASAEQSREQTEDASPDRKDAPDGEKQPEATAQPPVAGSTDQPPTSGDSDLTGASIVVTGPKQGRWRAGRRFDREPERIALDDLTDDELAALMADPRLAVVLEGAEPGKKKPALKAPKLARKRKPARSSKRGR